MTQVTVPIAELAVADGEATLVTIGLGSCVAVALYAPEHAIGALAHTVLPNINLTSLPPTPGKCASVAIPAMLKRMRDLGAAGEINARLIGGASMFAPLLAPGSLSLGARNVAAAHAACAASDVPIVAQDVGGVYGRSVYFEVATGAVHVRSIGRRDVEL
jgi:chemotaxis protein CheD